jgi:acyl homoserine lactone synthase
MELNFVAGTRQSLSAVDYNAMLRYRHRVFVEHLCWRLEGAHDGIETDTFDRDDTVYVGMRLQSSGELCGHARLLPTNRPYLLADAFPQLLPDSEPPRSVDVWEISRFAAISWNQVAEKSLQPQQFDAWLSRELLAYCMAWGAAQSLSYYVTVSPLGIGRLLQRMGVTARRLGPTLEYDGHRIFALRLDLSPRHLSNLGVESPTEAELAQAVRP